MAVRLQPTSYRPLSPPFDPQFVARRYLEHCVMVLRQSGSRVTRARIAVIHCLGSAVRSLTPRAIFAAILRDQSLPAIDQVTVYRTLKVFCDLGLVHRIGPNGEYVACGHIDCDHDQHALSHCLICGTAEERELPTEMLAPVLGYLTRLGGFTVREHFLQVNGICQACVRAGRRLRGED